MDLRFENDVKMYGIQTLTRTMSKTYLFENDVKMYGIQTVFVPFVALAVFENDVKMYGIQTYSTVSNLMGSLRMM